MNHPALPVERERKFIPSPALAAELTHGVMPVGIEQVYLSHPSEEFSLRLRRIGGTVCSATLKDRGRPDGPYLTRLEVETPLSAEIFSYYAPDHPSLRKLRYEPRPGVVVDRFSNLSVTAVEIEAEADDVAERHAEELTDLTATGILDNERIAHEQNPRLSARLRPQPAPDARSVARSILSGLERLGDRPLVVGIKGRSGSGKSTLARRVSDLVSQQTAVVTISTDDYHRGKQWLLRTHNVDSWSAWDDPVVYDTKSLAADLHAHIARGIALPARAFDFRTEEPAPVTEALPPARVILLEGLFPHSPDLTGLVDYLVEVPTSLATSIGRRILRDVGTRLNDSLGSASDILRYQLEVAEPAYRTNA